MSIKPPRDMPPQQTSSSKGNRFAPDHGRRVTKEEYWAKWYENPYPNIDVSYEWNNGILEAKPLPNAPQLRQYRWFYTLMACYIQTHPIADLINLETGVSMTVQDAAFPSGNWDVVYKPDIGVILNDNPAPWGAMELRAFEGVCDMIVEELSDSTRAEVRRDTEEKKRGYARAGVKEYFILDPTDRHMRFYILTWPGRYDEIQPDATGVIRSQVLPGFQFRRRDLLVLPDLQELALDEIYSDYVIPGFLDAVGRADAEAAARRQAEERSRQAEQQAAAEAAARRQAEERSQQAEQQAAAEAAARRQAEERAKSAEEDKRALQAELARLRRQRP